MQRHALMRHLKSQFEEHAYISPSELKTGLQVINPAASHSARTWDLYAGRTGRWLSATGILKPVTDGWLRQDVGDVVFTEAASRRGYRRQLGPFLGDARPAKVVQALEWLCRNQPSTLDLAKGKGFRNAVMVLTRFSLARSIGDGVVETDFEQDAEIDFDELIWQCAREEETLEFACDFQNKKPNSSGIQLGAFIGDTYKTNWTNSTKLRTGDALKTWTTWIIAGESRDKIPPAPGAMARISRIVSQELPVFLTWMGAGRSAMELDGPLSLRTTFSGGIKKDQSLAR